MKRVSVLYQRLFYFTFSQSCACCTGLTYCNWHECLEHSPFYWNPFLLFFFYFNPKLPFSVVQCNILYTKSNIEQFTSHSSAGGQRRIAWLLPHHPASPSPRTLCLNCFPLAPPLIEQQAIFSVTLADVEENTVIQLNLLLNLFWGWVILVLFGVWIMAVISLQFAEVFGH